MRVIRWLSLLAALSLALAACGSSSTTSTSASGLASNSSARYQARLNLAKCLRAHGLNVPDPSPTSGGAGFRALANYPRSEIESAIQGCHRYLVKAFPVLGLSASQRAQLQQQLVKFAQCMRSHGVNIPDPGSTTGGGFGFRQGFRALDRNSPAFQSALTACQSLRPRFGRRGSV
jgi:hypothetical protein